uniref:Reverse transcriptase domain-containing protein n=1 Tax=Dendroctonus ponderosae TaxID=77166 RepID=A0AAR5P7F6_DENPD
MSIDAITPTQWHNAVNIILHKKGVSKVNSNIYKLFTKVLTKRLENKFEFYQSREQAGFRSGYGTNDHILAIKNMIEKCVEYNEPLLLIFVDYEKALDIIISHGKMLEALTECRIDHQYTNIIHYIYRNATASIGQDDRQTEKFPIQHAVPQGDTIPPRLFTTLLECACKRANLSEKGINTNGENLNHLRFANDIDSSLEVGLKINMSKTQIMTNLILSESINIAEAAIDQTTAYKYLGHKICLGRDIKPSN